MSTPEILPPSEPQPTVAPAPPRYTIFRGPNGIRAGWRALIFVVIVIGLGAVLTTILRFLVHGQHQIAQQLSPAALSLSEGVTFLFTSVAALIMARMEHRKYGQYGLPARLAFRKDFWIGTLVGFASISACLLAIFVLHGFRVTGLAIHGQTILISIVAWSATFVLVGLAEEFSFRGYLQYTLTTGIGYWPAAILLSVLFGVAHAGNPGETKLGDASVVLFALLFCLFLRRRGNLWWPVGFHVGWDWGQTFFYGVPDSGLQPYHNFFSSSFSGPSWLTGGTVGPEASIFTPIVLGIVAILFALAYRQNLYTTDAVATPRGPEVGSVTSDIGSQTSA